MTGAAQALRELRLERARRHSVPFVLPAPVSPAHAAAVLVIGFLLEAATELTQLALGPASGTGSLAYDAALAAAIAGLYLIFLGTREWRLFHPGSRRDRRVPWRLIQLFAAAGVSTGLWLGRHSRWVRKRHFALWAAGLGGATATLVVSSAMVEHDAAAPRSREVPWTSLALWAGGTGVVLALLLASGASGRTPVELAAPVGGAVVLLFGNFFRGLRREADRVPTTATRVASGAAVVWALGVGAVAGAEFGSRFLLFLGEFGSNWAELASALSPVFVAISPLCVSFALMSYAFGRAVRTAAPVPGLRSGSPVESAPSATGR
jgi:hypothetical protein